MLLWVLLIVYNVTQISFLHLYCDVCHRVLYFTCSSCSMNTDERIHVYCRNTDTVNNDGTFLYGVKKLVEKPNSSLIMDNNYVNTQRYIQNQINDEINVIQLIYQLHTGTMCLNP